MANTRHAIVRLDVMSGTTDKAMLKSAKYFNDSDEKATIENGNLVKLTTLLEGERELYKAVTPTASDTLKDIALVATPELIYDESTYHGLEDYINEADKAIRVYRLHDGDTFSVTGEALSTTEDVVAGYFATVGATTKIVPSETATGTVIGKIIAVETVGNDKYYVIAVNMK